MQSDELRALILRVNMAFYDRIYKDPWMKKVFRIVPQEHIVNQQTDFMLGALGGPKVYSGRSPSDAHPHIFVTEKMWQRREAHLVAAFAEVGVSEEIRVKWLKIDNAFKRAIVKTSVGECQKRFTMDEIIDEVDPDDQLKAA